MGITDLLNRPCTIHSFDSEVSDWGEPVHSVTSSVDALCYFEQTDATEVVVGQETYWADGHIFLPADTVIDAAAWVELDGAMYEVIGRPAVWEKPDLTVSHITANVREVTSS